MSLFGSGEFVLLSWWLYPYLYEGPIEWILISDGREAQTPKNAKWLLSYSLQSTQNTSPSLLLTFNRQTFLFVPRRSASEAVEPPAQEQAECRPQRVHSRKRKKLIEVTPLIDENKIEVAHDFHYAERVEKLSYYFISCCDLKEKEYKSP